MDEKKLIGAIETILFAIGRGVSVEYIKNLIEKTYNEKVTDKEIIEGLKKIKEFYNGSYGLKVYENNELWFLSSREEFVNVISNLTDEVDLTKSVLETLAVIAWKAPVLQSEIIELRNVKAYEHIEILEKRGFIKCEKFGNTKLIKLTDKFFDYFDLEGSTNLKELFSQKLKEFEEKIKQKKEKVKKNEAENVNPTINKDESLNELTKLLDEKKENASSNSNQPLQQQDLTELNLIISETNDNKSVENTKTSADNKIPTENSQEKPSSKDFNAFNQQNIKEINRNFENRKKEGNKTSADNKKSMTTIKEDKMNMKSEKIILKEENAREKPKETTLNDQKDISQKGNENYESLNTQEKPLPKSLFKKNRKDLQQKRANNFENTDIDEGNEDSLRKRLMENFKEIYEELEKESQ